jgi:hypothetical protein
MNLKKFTDNYNGRIQISGYFLDGKKYSERKSQAARIGQN